MPRAAREADVTFILALSAVYKDTTLSYITTLRLGLMVIVSCTQLRLRYSPFPLAGGWLFRQICDLPNLDLTCKERRFAFPCALSNHR